MPSRYVREGLLDSDGIRRGGEGAEVLFVRLLLVVDDFARFDGRPVMIARRCWPAGDDGDLPAPSAEDVKARLEILVRERLVVMYQVGGKPYLLIPKFRQRTRAVRSKYPDPPENLTALTERPTDDGQMSGKWRSADGQAPDTCPRPASVVRGSVFDNGVAHAGQMTDKSRTKAREFQGGISRSTGQPMLGSDKGDSEARIAKTRATINEQREAQATAAPMPAEIRDRFVTPGNGTEAPIATDEQATAPAPEPVADHLETTQGPSPF